MGKTGGDLGAGEILLTSMNNDGTKDGFAEESSTSISKSIQFTCNRFRGAGTMQHFADVFKMLMQMQLWRRVFFIIKKLKYLP